MKPGESNDFVAWGRMLPLVTTMHARNHRGQQRSKRKQRLFCRQCSVRTHFPSYCSDALIRGGRYLLHQGVWFETRLSLVRSGGARPPNKFIIRQAFKRKSPRVPAPELPSNGPRQFAPTHKEALTAGDWDIFRLSFRKDGGAVKQE